MKRILFMMFVIGSLYSGRAQNFSPAVTLTGGWAEDGFALSMNYNYYIQRKQFIEAGLFGLFGNDTYKDQKIPYQIFAAQIGYFHSLFESGRGQAVNFAFGGGLTGGYEVINHGNNTLSSGAIITDKSQFVYGLYAGLEVDLYLNHAFSLLLKANQYYHINSDLGQFTPYVGVGLRYYLF